MNIKLLEHHSYSKLRRKLPGFEEETHGKQDLTGGWDGSNYCILVGL
jgi:hypothetical protein